MSFKVFLFLIILVGIVLGLPHLNFQDSLAQGDHGRDLYAFEQVFHGKLIYKDIWWVYGPLMPYYYGFFNLIFGIKISSVLLGKYLLTIICGTFFYLAASVVMSTPWAFLAAWYFLQMQQDFFFTYNHIGGIACGLAAFWLVLKYIHQPDKNIRLGYGALLSCLILGFIKINFGVTSLLVVLLGIAATDFSSGRSFKELLGTNRKLFYVCGFLGVPLLWLIVYVMLLGGLTSYEIHQCMPYFGDDQPHHQSPLNTIPYYLQQHWLTLYYHSMYFINLVPQILHQPGGLLSLQAAIMTTLVTTNFLTHPILHLSTLAVLILVFTKKFDGKRKAFWLTQLVIWSFFILNFHEFLVSGVWYRTYWSQPYQTFFDFYMVAMALFLAPRWLRYIIGSIWVVFLLTSGFISLAKAQEGRTPDKYLAMPRGQIYVGNESPWVDTVNTVTGYLIQNLKKDELFFALPYDCLYYYTTGKPSPTRQLIFFDHIKIPREQEISVIKELEKNNVNYVVLSNRFIASEIGLGKFGQSYCPLLYQYVMEYFKPVAKYGGNWQAEPGWANNHGVIIFKRK